MEDEEGVLSLGCWKWKKEDVQTRRESQEGREGKKKLDKREKDGARRRKSEIRRGKAMQQRKIKEKRENKVAFNEHRQAQFYPVCTGTKRGQVDVDGGRTMGHCESTVIRASRYIVADKTFFCLFFCVFMLCRDGVIE